VASIIQTDTSEDDPCPILWTVWNFDAGLTFLPTRFTKPLQAIPKDLPIY